MTISACSAQDSRLPTEQFLRWSFDRPSSSNWTITTGNATRTPNGRLRVDFTESTVLLSPAGLRLDSQRYNVVMVRAKTWNDDDSMTLLWQLGSRVESMDVPIINSGEETYTYYFDLSQSPSWKMASPVQQIGLMPTRQGARGDMEIEEIRILPRTALLEASIRWGEFSRPEYLSQFAKILSVGGTGVGGQPLNAIAYWLIALGIAVVYLVSALRRSIPAWLRWLDSRALLVLCLVLWLALAARFGLDQWHTLQRDTALFAGKPMLGKQSALLSGTYRQFLGFAQETLPANSSVRLITNDLAFWMAQYYLYPLRISETALLYLVYDFPNGAEHFQFDSSAGTLVRITDQGERQIIGSGLVLVAQFDANGAIYEARQ
ncbi:MAG: hypothetical protein EPO21_13905 [Chloroflexota bacterium]|nr:MAG: hypothetical protein EPO21_13905 [Chloroflexota bacterium]